MDDDDSVPVDYRMITQESMESYPLSYTVEQYGYHPKKVALSFDDGMDDNHAVVLPLLTELGLTATVYVTTGLIGKPPEHMIVVFARKSFVAGSR